MKRNAIKRLAQLGFNKNGIDANKVTKIAKSLKRQELKVFIKDLRNIEAKRTVKITVPSQEGFGEIKTYLTKLFPGKKLILSVDPTLLSGIKVEDYDNVYELSVKGFLEHAIKGRRYD